MESIQNKNTTFIESQGYRMQTLNVKVQSAQSVLSFSKSANHLQYHTLTKESTEWQAT